MNNEKPLNIAPKMLVIIVDRVNGERLEDLLREKLVRFHYMFNAMGTASSEILKAFGLSGTEKIACICLEPAAKLGQVMNSVVERLELTHPGNGICFVMPVSGISLAVSKMFAEELEQYKERLADWMDMESEMMKEDCRFELIISVVNQGYSEQVMEAARSAGARGGTIVHARRSGLEDVTKFFGVSLQAEKEIVAILVPRSYKKELMQLITKTCGTNTDARGIIISLPVESCAGISMAEE